MFSLTCLSSYHSEPDEENEVVNVSLMTRIAERRYSSTVNAVDPHASFTDLQPNLDAFQWCHLVYPSRQADLQLLPHHKSPSPSPPPRLLFNSLTLSPIHQIFTISLPRQALFVIRFMIHLRKSLIKHSCPKLFVTWFFYSFLSNPRSIRLT
jgi:hypothetical protein